MSDYLSNLAARTLGLTDGMRPRLPSRFEPPAHVNDVYSQNSESGATRQSSATTPRQNLSPQDLTASTPRAEAARRGEDSSLLPRRRHDERRAEHPSEHANHESLRSEPAFSNPLNEVSSEEENHTTAARVEKATRINPAPPTKNDAAADETKHLDGSGTSLRRSGGQNLEERVALLEAEKSRHGAGEKHAHPSSAESFTPAPPFDPPPPVAPRSIRPRGVALSPSHKERAEVENSAPHIKITIGRVEVRAVMPAAPPARPPRARPATPSLDEYLKKGERGAR